MRRFFFTSFIVLALVISAAGAAPAAHATTVADCANNFPDGGTDYNACIAPLSGVSDCANNFPNGGPEYDSCLSAITSGSSPSAANSATPAANAANTIANTSNVPAAVKDDPNAPYNSIMMKIMSLFAWLVGTAALTLNWAVYFTVVTMGTYVKNLGAVGATWTILRDIGNIFLIFGFLAVGVTIIMNVDWYGGGKKMLPMMLVAAVFLNFSLFITEAFIDVSNLFATQFYIQINGPLTSTDATLTQLSTQGIAGKIMNQLGLMTLYNVSSNQGALTSSNPWFIGFLGIILFIILAFVMFSLAFVLIARFIILLFLIIVSPIAFAGLAVPGLQKRMKAWWDKLFEQIMTAPILLLMLYIALRVITVPQFISGFHGGTDLTNASSGNLLGYAGTLLSFLVAMGMLLAVVIQSKNLSAFGSSNLMKLGQNAASGATKFVGRSALGAGRYAANRSVGRLANWGSQKIMTSPIGQNQFGRLAATGLAKGGKGYKEVKEKSAKTHDEYVKSVGKAIEEKHAPGIAAAMQNRATTEKAIEKQMKAAEAAKKEKEAATQKVKSLEDMIPRLEQVVNDNMKKNIIDVGAINTRNEARAALPLAEKEEKKADEKVRTTEAAFTKASEDVGLAAAMEEEEKATKALAKAKREAALGYAEKLQPAFERPFAWAVAGQAQQVAANKIIMDTLKKMTDEQKALDTLKKALAKEASVSGQSAKKAEELNESKEDLKNKIANEAGTP